MSRRLVAALVAAACFTPPLLPAAHAADPELPRMDCKSRFTDPEGDSIVAQGQSVPSTDILSAFMRVTADEVQAFIAVKDLKAPGEMEARDTAYAWTFQAKFGEKTMQLGVAQKSTSPVWATVPAAANANLEQFPMANTGTGDANKLAGATAVIVHAKDTIAFQVPRASAESNFGAPLAEGAQFTNIKATAIHWVASKQGQIDGTTQTDLVWSVGDDRCFGPPPATLSDLTATAVQFSDTATLSAKLVSEAGTALAGKRVEFRVAGDTRPPVVGTTNAGGIATAKYVASQLPAGTKILTATFPGDATDGKATFDGTIAIAAEPTAFAPSVVGRPTATTRTVTVTLLDNDKKPVAGQAIAWYVNAKKVATGKTDSKGKAVLKTAKPTQTVQAKFTGLAGKYLASNSKAVKV